MATFYTKSYKDYLDFLEWAKTHTFTCPNGIVVDFLYSIWIYPEDVITNNYTCIASTSETADYFLIKYCPLKFIQNRLSEIYNYKYIKEVLNGTSDYDKFVYPEIGKNKVKILYYNKNIKINRVYHIEVCFGSNYKSNLYYNEIYDKWLFLDELGDWQGTTAYCCKSLKALIRKIRKWKLPKGCIIGAFVGGELKYKFIVK